MAERQHGITLERLGVVGHGDLDIDRPGQPAVGRGVDPDFFGGAAGGGGAPLDGALAVLHAEHADLERNMAALGQMSNAFTAPHSASAEWRALYAGLAKFADALAEHTPLADEVLFPRFEAPPP